MAQAKAWQKCHDNSLIANVSMHTPKHDRAEFEHKRNLMCFPYNHVYGKTKLAMTDKIGALPRQPIGIAVPNGLFPYESTKMAA